MVDIRTFMHANQEIVMCGKRGRSLPSAGAVNAGPLWSGAQSAADAELERRMPP